ncbi:hypothetical protein Dda_4956 [Drechslerella dactyloides]|uniref:Uncharacterized protein n=1 Tax=Drechslerella dactyloides TaxID=74499 RepID=A0AAD6J2B4_DREDA|nr:hypothetical protein Dda_4956 [Drechslerella dactyloides]
MSNQPATPNASSIRDFWDRTDIPPDTLARSYRRNSRCPVRPSPDTSVYPNDFESPNFFVDSEITPPMHDPTESLVADIAAHLQENMQTPTRSMSAAARRAEINAELNRHMDAYEPTTTLQLMRTPTAATSVSRKHRTSSASPDARRSLLSEDFPSLSNSAKKMPLHPAYNVRTSVDRSILKMHFTHHSTPAQSFDQEPASDEDIYMDVDEYVDSDEANKENIDPMTRQTHETPATYSFETPPGSGSRNVILTPIKRLLTEKKLTAIRRSGTTESSSREKASNPNSNMDLSSDIFSTPQSDDMGIFEDTTLACISDNPFDSPTAVDIQTPTTSPAKRDTEYSGFPPLQHTPCLKSKLGLITASSNSHGIAPPNVLSDFDPQKLAQRKNIHGPASPTPPAPMPQKLLHKSAKEREVYTRSTEALGLRSAEKLREMRRRNSSVTHESGVVKRKSRTGSYRGYTAEYSTEMGYAEDRMVGVTKDTDYANPSLGSHWIGI